MRTTIPAAVLATTFLTASLAIAGATPEQKCEAGKNGAAGKYAACLLKSQRKFVSGGGTDTTGLDTAVTECGAKYSLKWQSLETKAGTTVCPSEGDEGPIQDFLDACVFSTQGALSTGGALPADVVTCNADLGTCSGSLGTCTGNLDTCSSNLTTCNSNYSSCSSSLGTCAGELAVCDAGYASCSSSLATVNAGDAAAGDVLEGRTFSSAAGLGSVGTMPDNGAVTLTPGTSDQPIAAGYHDGSGKCDGDADLVAANILRGVDLFGVTGTLPPAEPLKTGQTFCYSAAGANIACAGTGHDGEFQKGIASSFTDNGDGTVSDETTGLMWEKLSDDGTIHDKDDAYTWTNAFTNKIATLNSMVFAGYSDWRLPNRAELLTLVNLATNSPAAFSAFHSSCAAGCTILTCSCTFAHVYWSSTSYQATPPNAWYVNFLSGNSDQFTKASTVRVRAVRGGA